jgi:hypothetical protein
MNEAPPPEEAQKPVDVSVALGAEHTLGMKYNDQNRKIAAEWTAQKQQQQCKMQAVAQRTRAEAALHRAADEAERKRAHAEADVNKRAILIEQHAQKARQEAEEHAYRNRQSALLTIMAVTARTQHWIPMYTARLTEHKQLMRRARAATKIQRLFRRAKLRGGATAKVKAARVIRRVCTQHMMRRKVVKKRWAADMLRLFIDDLKTLSSIKKAVSTFIRKVQKCQQFVKSWYAVRQSRIAFYQLQLDKLDQERLSKLHSQARRTHAKYLKRMSKIDTLTKKMLAQSTSRAMIREAETFVKTSKELQWLYSAIEKNIRLRDMQIREARTNRQWSRVVALILPPLPPKELVPIVHIADSFKRLKMLDLYKSNVIKNRNDAQAYIGELAAYEMRQKQRDIFKLVISDIEKKADFDVEQLPQSFRELLQQEKPPKPASFEAVLPRGVLERIINDMVMMVEEDTCNSKQSMLGWIEAEQEVNIGIASVADSHRHEAMHGSA